MLKENKQEICDYLCEALVRTRQYDDLVSLTYDKDQEIVTAKFENGGRILINVNMDSGWAMIKDIVGQLKG